MRTKCILIAAVSLLSGCSSTSNIKPDFSFGPNPEVGLVVLSTTEDYRCKVIFGNHSNLRYTKIGGEFDWLQMVLVTNPFQKNDFKDPPGSLAILPLEEGEYRFTSYESDDGAWRIMTRLRLPSFRVKAGEIIYLGEIHILVPPDGKSVRVTVSDKSGRDLALFDKRMVNFSAADVRNLQRESASRQSEAKNTDGAESGEPPGQSEGK